MYAESIALVSMCASAACSVYALTFSLLELYYIQTVHGLDLSIENARDESDPAEAQLDSSARSSAGRQPGIGTHAESTHDSTLLRMALATDVDKLFEKLAWHRHLARNTMWTSLLCLLGAAASRIVGIFWDVRPFGFGIAGCALLLVGGLTVLVTVTKFRKEYVALIRTHGSHRNYHWSDFVKSEPAHGTRPCVSSLGSRRAPSRAAPSPPLVATTPSFHTRPT